MDSNTTAAPVALTTNRAFNYHFKKDEMGEKRASFKLDLPVPTLDGVLAALNDEKQREYILDVLAQEIYKTSRAQVNDEQKPVSKQEELDVSKLSLKAIAEMPKAERTGGGISKEVWADFSKDYISVMPAVTGKTAEQVGNAAKLLVAKYQPVKTNKQVISFLREQLALWFTSTPNKDDYQDCYDFLDNKAETLLNADEASLLANL